MRTRARADQVVAFVRYRGAVGAASPRPSSLWGEGELQTFAAIMRSTCFCLRRVRWHGMVVWYPKPRHKQPTGRAGVTY